jgi:hypothetical protein
MKFSPEQNGEGIRMVQDCLARAVTHIILSEAREMGYPRSNSALIVNKHYLQVTEADFERGAKSDALAAQNATQHPATQTHTESHLSPVEEGACEFASTDVTVSESTSDEKYARRGSNPQPADPKSADTDAQTLAASNTSADSFRAGDRALTKPDTASDPELARVLAAWPSLSEPIRAAILALVAASTPST